MKGLHLQLFALALGLLLASHASATRGNDNDRNDNDNHRRGGFRFRFGGASQSKRNSFLARRVVEHTSCGRTWLIQRAFRDDFFDHVTGQTGTAAVVERTEAMRQTYPQARVRVYRVISEGDLVFVHAKLKLERRGGLVATGDLFRFQDGRIAEHWGAFQPVPSTTRSGNDMFGTLSAPRRFRPDRNANLNATRDAVNQLGFQLLFLGNDRAWDTTTRPPYYQHSINTDNGADAAAEVWGRALTVTEEEEDTPVIGAALVNALVEGDLSVSLATLQAGENAADLNLMPFDISRVTDGLIVEHWDIIQDLNLYPLGSLPTAYSEDTPWEEADPLKAFNSKYSPSDDDSD